MTRVEILKFKVSNWASHAFTSDERGSSYRQALADMVTPNEMKRKVNEALEDIEWEGGVIKDIHVNELMIHQHNNGRGNMIDMVYTIVYEKKEG